MVALLFFRICPMQICCFEIGAVKMCVKASY